MIRRAAIRLCEDSTIWREDLAPADIVVGEDDYTITPPSGTRVVSLISVMINKVPIATYTEEELDVIDYGWRNGTDGTPFAYIIPEPNRFKFNRKPDTAYVGGLVVRVALKPTETATGVDDILFNDWRECIRNGALHYLMEMKGKPWSDPVEAKRYGFTFNSQIQRATARITQGRHRKPVRAVMQPF